MKTALQEIPSSPPRRTPQSAGEKPTMPKTNEEGSVFNFLYSFLFTFVLLIHRIYNKHASRLTSLKELDLLPENQQYTHVLEDVEANELIAFIDSIVDGLPEPQHTIYHLYQQYQFFLLTGFWGFSGFITAHRSLRCYKSGYETSGGEINSAFLRGI
jgi:hypothetical protein